MSSHGARGHLASARLAIILSLAGISGALAGGLPGEIAPAEPMLAQADGSSAADREWSDEEIEELEGEWSDEEIEKWVEEDIRKSERKAAEADANVAAIEAALACLQKIDPEEIVRECSTALDSGLIPAESIPALRFQRGFAKIRLAMHDDALVDLNESIRLRKDKPEPYYWRGLIYLETRTGTADQALSDFERAAAMGFKLAAEAKELLLRDMLATSLEGIYEAQGTNPDGSRYAGTCRITKVGQNQLKFDWSVGGSYLGTGSIDGKTITVDWGSDAPVVYQVQADGTLVGTWASGRATETLRPQR